MNKTIAKLGGAFLLSLVMSSQAIAAFVLNGTRFIYEEGKKNTSIEVTNQSTETYGGQTWIDNTNQGNSQVYMVMTPPFFRVAPKEKQLVRIIKTDTALPSDRESLFWLNVQEIPPMPKNNGEGVLAVAINTKVKLIYRPKSLLEGRNDAERFLRIIHRGREVFLHNPTPYYFAVTAVKINGKDVKLNDAILSQITQLPPKSEVSLGNVILNGSVSVEAVNDWGGLVNYSLK
ncbi:fimbrial chaperone [Escherichia coli]|uniref:fimbrial chaperone n=1 Tax=Escherichia coli TaxID=562 RepID=UPI0019190F8C|nr:fimbrial chaperone [Escherichia coli]CAD5746653.1 putative fimbrial assembly chaperone FanE [Escherichia coli]